MEPSRRTAAEGSTEVRIAAGTGDRVGAWIVAIATAGAAFLYFSGLDVQSLWLDELYTVTTSTGSLADLYAFWSWDRHPPTYGLLLHAWASVFGSGEVAVRSLSALAATVAVPTTYLLARRSLPNAVAVATAVLLATSTTTLYYAQEARVYALLMLACSISTFAWLELMRTTRGGSSDRGAVARFAVAGLVASSLHYYGWALVVFQVGYWIAVASRRSRPPATLAAVALVALGPATIELVVHALFLFESVGRNAIPPPSVALVRSIVGLWFSGGPYVVLGLFLVTPVSWLIAGVRRSRAHVLGFIGPVADHRQAIFDLFWLMALPMGVLLVSSFVVPTLIPRNAIVFLPAAYALLATWLAFAPPLRGMRLPIAVAAFATVVLLSELPDHAAPRKQQWREAVHTAVAISTPGTLLASVERATAAPLDVADIGRGSLWRYYFARAGADLERAPFDRMVAVANAPAAMEALIAYAHDLGSRHLVLVYAHVPGPSREVLEVVQRASEAVEATALLDAGVFSVTLGDADLD